MPGGLDYSRFDKLDISDSEEDEPSKGADAASKAEEVLADLPPDLPEELSLVLAAREGQQNIVEALLERRAAVDSCDPHGGTALLRAVEGGISNRPVIELLLRRRADLLAKSSLGDSPMSSAAVSGPAPLLQALLDAGSPSAEMRAIALVAASAAGNEVTSRLLLEAAGTPAVGDDGRSALHHWAQKGNEGFVESLLAARADPAVHDINGIAPLACAVRSGNAKIIKMLCQHNAPLDHTAANGETALVVAVGLVNEQCSEVTVATLLELRANVEATSAACKSSPLVAAACTGRRAVVAQLLQARASVDIADAAGRRALPCAASAGTFELCELLLESRAAVDARSTSGASLLDASSESLGVTALSIAAASAKTRLVEVLLAAGANPEVFDEREQTPLMAASSRGCLDICAMLLQSRASVDTQQSTSGKTALLLAASSGHAKVCSTLLESHADPHTSGTSGAGTLHAAAANGHDDVCLLLLAAKVAPSVVGPGGEDAVAMATTAGHARIVELLKTQAIPGDPDAQPGA